MNNPAIIIVLYLFFCFVASLSITMLYYYVFDGYVTKWIEYIVDKVNNKYFR
jgi:hypothetical protein